MYIKHPFLFPCHALDAVSNLHILHKYTGLGAGPLIYDWAPIKTDLHGWIIFMTLSSGERGTHRIYLELDTVMMSFDTTF